MLKREKKNFPLWAISLFWAFLLFKIGQRHLILNERKILKTFQSVHIDLLELIILRGVTLCFRLHLKSFLVQFGTSFISNHSVILIIVFLYECSGQYNSAREEDFGQKEICDTMRQVILPLCSLVNISRVSTAHS